MAAQAQRNEEALAAVRYEQQQLLEEQRTQWLNVEENLVRELELLKARAEEAEKRAGERAEAEVAEKEKGFKEARFALVSYPFPWLCSVSRLRRHGPACDLHCADGS